VNAGHLEPLLEEDVSEYLAERGLDAGARINVTTLTDGVSARVYRVDGDSAQWVVKQALPELAVATTWVADPRRAMTEARALELLGTVSPGMVPHLIDADPERSAITMTAAPTSWTNWRSILLSGDDDPRRSRVRTEEIASTLGQTLGSWHRATWGRAEIAEQFSDDEAFEQLRITPFHRAITAVHPDLQDRLDVLIDEVTHQAQCLVHGDFSPKNILIGDVGLWVLDFEVARYGAAVFDLAFFGHHIALKAIARPETSSDMVGAFALFLESYLAVVDHDPRLELLGWHSAALLLARVDGVSPAPYLTPAQRATARRVARGALTSTRGSNAEFWNLVLEAAHGGLQ
jgi:5-methylthioribose kinase